MVRAAVAESATLDQLFMVGGKPQVIHSGDCVKASRRFTGRKEHRLGNLVHFAEVTVQAEPCLGESEVVLSEEVLDTLREVFGPDFEHQRHCVSSAVSVQLSTINVGSDFPLAGAASFRAEVVGVRVSGNVGREVSGFLFSVAAMDAIGDYLTFWEHEQEGQRNR
jgi:hypothetical protein